MSKNLSECKKLPKTTKINTLKVPKNKQKVPKTRKKLEKKIIQKVPADCQALDFRKIFQKITPN